MEDISGPTPNVTPPPEQTQEASTKDQLTDWAKEALAAEKRSRERQAGLDYERIERARERMIATGELAIGEDGVYHWKKREE